MTPDPKGRTFLHWKDNSGNIVSTQQNFTYQTGNSDNMLEAVYQDILYTVKVTGGSGGGDYKEGANVIITLGAEPQGQVFSHWENADTGANMGTSKTINFTMPAENVNVKAVFTTVATPAPNRSGEVYISNVTVTFSHSEQTENTAWFGDDDFSFFDDATEEGTKSTWDFDLEIANETGKDIVTYMVALRYSGIVEGEPYEQHALLTPFDGELTWGSADGDFDTESVDNTIKSGQPRSFFADDLIHISSFDGTDPEILSMELILTDYYVAGDGWFYGATTTEGGSNHAFPNVPNVAEWYRDDGKGEYIEEWMAEYPVVDRFRVDVSSIG